MKILYIANIRIPTEKAHGIQIMKMCESFAQLGHEVSLIVPTRFNENKNDPYEYYGIKRNFKIITLPVLDFVTLGKIGFLIESLSFSISAFFYVLFKKKDLVFSRDEIVLFPLACIGTSIFLEAHMPRQSFLTMSFLKRVDKFITISQGLKDFYISKGFSDKDILVVHDAVDLKDFKIEVSTAESRQKLGINKDLFTIMYIGRIDAWKGVETLLKATQDIKKIQTVIIGEGPQLQEFKKNYPHAMYLGYLPYKDLPINQNAADILVIPNSGKSQVSSFYTSPLKVFAHMTSGIPLVVSDLPSMREVLSQKNAFFAEPDNPDSFRNAILEVRNNYKTALLKAEIASEDVKEYTWIKRAKSIIDFYES